MDLFVSVLSSSMVIDWSELGTSLDFKPAPLSEAPAGPLMGGTRLHTNRYQIANSRL